MAAIRHNHITFALLLLSCAFFLWMFFAAAALEHTADLGGTTSSSEKDARAAAYEYAARWRHGMAGNSPVYMPGFFAVAIAVWFWSARKTLWRTLAEGLLVLGGAAVLASLLASYAAPRIVSSFQAQEHFTVSQTASSGTWVSSAQGVYSLLTWATVIIAARWSIKRKSFKPLLVPFALNVILALVRPWTVADFTSMWVSQALDGKPVAVISFMLIPLLAGLMAWVELRPTLRRRRHSSAAPSNLISAKAPSIDSL